MLGTGIAINERGPRCLLPDRAKRNPQDARRGHAKTPALVLHNRLRIGFMRKTQDCSCRRHISEDELGNDAV